MPGPVRGDDAETAAPRDLAVPGVAAKRDGGCNTGANEAGSNKLKEVADVTGVTVKAPTGKVYGDCTEEAGSVHQKGYPGSPALPPIGTPGDEKKRKKEEKGKKEGKKKGKKKGKKGKKREKKGKKKGEKRGKKG